MAQIVAWIDLGAPYGIKLLLIDKAVVKKPKQVTDEDRKYWAFQPLHRPAEPKVADASWRRTADRFVCLGEARRKGTDAEHGPAERRKLIPAAPATWICSDCRRRQRRSSRSWLTRRPSPPTRS